MKYLIKLWKYLTFGLALGLTSCVTYGNEHRMLAAIEVLQEEELAEQVSMALTAEQRERLIDDLVDLPEGLAETLRAAEEETVSLTVGEWHDIVIAIRKDQVRNPERYDEKGPLAEILLKLVVELEEAGYPHNRHPTAVRWQKEHLVIAENLSSLPSRARVRIVDQDGEPVEGVTLEIDKSILRPLAWEPTSRMRTVTVDGERTIRIGGAFVDDINLTARKEGYYTARRSVRQPRRENVEGLTERAWKDVVLGRETVIDPEEPKLLNVVLELRKKGEIVQLYWFRGTLEIRSDGSGRIIRLHPPEGRRPGRTVIMERQGIVHEVDDVLEHIQESDDPREVAFMVAFEDGEILEKTSKRIGQRDRHFPGNLVFLSSDEEGGFQLSPEQENRLMIEAPEDGYEPKLEVSYSELGDDNLWYYFKADGHYGKMSLGPPNLTLTVDEEGFSWVRYQVTFSLNPTAGDRNLEHGL